MKIVFGCLRAFTDKTIYISQTIAGEEVSCMTERKYLKAEIEIVRFGEDEANVDIITTSGPTDEPESRGDDWGWTGWS